MAGRREVPHWVIDWVAGGGDPSLAARGLVLRDGGIVIDCWPSTEDVEHSFLYGTSSTTEPVGLLAESGRWRDAGLGVQQWVTL